MNGVDKIVWASIRTYSSHRRYVSSADVHGYISIMAMRPALFLIGSQTLNRKNAKNAETLTPTT